MWAKISTYICWSKPNNTSLDIKKMRMRYLDLTNPYWWDGWPVSFQTNRYGRVGRWSWSKCNSSRLRTWWSALFGTTDSRNAWYFACQDVPSKSDWNGGWWNFTLPMRQGILGDSGGVRCISPNKWLHALACPICLIVFVFCIWTKSWWFRQFGRYPFSQTFPHVLLAVFTILT